MVTLQKKTGAGSDALTVTDNGTYYVVDFDGNKLFRVNKSNGDFEIAGDFKARKTL